MGFYADAEEELLHADMAEVYKNRGLHQSVCAKHKGTTELHLTSGYKKAPGDQCKGGLTFEEPTLLCEQNMSVEEEVEHHWGYALAAIGVGAGVCLLIVLYISYKRAASGNVQYERVS